MSIRLWILGVLVLVAGSAAHPQTRPECAAPSHPGACFSTFDGEGENFYACGSPPAGEGLLFWSGIGAEDNDFIRTNLDGTMYAHVSDSAVTGVYCTWDTIVAGNCVADSGEIFVGSVNLQADGLIDEFGNALCPFVAQTRGEVRRVSDGHPVQILGRLLLVPDRDDIDPPIGCRIQTCSILAPGRRNE